MKKQKNGSAPLFWRMMTWIVVCWVILLSVTMMVTMRYAIQTFQNKIDEILISTVESLRSTPTVREMILSGVCDREMDDYLDGVIEYTNDLDYITIANTDSVRVYHVDPDKIGQPFDGGDQYRALEGECYLTDTKPANREISRRAFGPVYDEEGNIIGFVMAAARHGRIDELRENIYRTYLGLGGLLLLLTLLISGALAMYLGKRLRGVRTDDMIRMYLTQNDVINALDEGLISFDNTGRIRLVNAATAKILGTGANSLVGRNIDDILRAEDGTSLRDRGNARLQSNRPNIMVQAVRLPDANLWARQVLILADKTEVARYTEDLFGTRHMVNTLRANNHEFMNKLQVISGLLQMGQVERAQSYIGDIADVHEHITGPVLQRIRNTSVGALILGKGSNMRERDVDFVLMTNSYLPEQSRYLTTDELVTVVGNLLENAIEATDIIPAEDLRAVSLQLTEDDKGLLIQVSDTGTGIEDEVLPKIFNTGFSTKADTGRGVGMSRIKEIVDRRGGSIEVETEPGSGTTFTLIFSRERGGYA